MSSSTFGRLFLLIVVAIATAGAGFWFGLHHNAAAGETRKDEAETTQPSEEDKPLVPVVTAPLAVQHITETIKAYGTVVAEAADVHAVSVPFESHVLRVLVTPGQQVAQGTPLVQLEASPDALISLQEAKNALGAAQNDLQQTQRRFEQHLGTNTELSQSQQAAQSAKLKLDSLTQRGVGEKHDLKADFAGIVFKGDVQEGQIVPAGAPLLELEAGNRIGVQLNVEPTDAQSLKPGAQVELTPVDGTDAAKPIAGTVRIVGQRVDPATRLVEVRVSLPPQTSLLLDSFVTGQIERSAADALVVPHNAALPNEDGTYSLFTVKDNHAVEHKVRIGLQNDKTSQVIADDLKPGDPVIITGNYLVKDGTQVEIEAPATQPTTEPAENKATESKPEAKE